MVPVTSAVHDRMFRTVFGALPVKRVRVPLAAVVYLPTFGRSLWPSLKLISLVSCKVIEANF